MTSTSNPYEQSQLNNQLLFSTASTREYQDTSINQQYYDSAADLYRLADVLTSPGLVNGLLENARATDTQNRINNAYSRAMGPWEIFNGVFAGLYNPMEPVRGGVEPTGRQGEITLPDGTSFTARPVELRNAPEAPSQRYEVTPEQASSVLRQMGVREDTIPSVIASFSGPIYLRGGLPGESFGVYSGGPERPATGQYLSPGTAGQTPSQVIDNLALPSSNPATYMNWATINQRIPVLEGVIAPQNFDGNATKGGSWQVFVPNGMRFGTNPPVTLGPVITRPR